MELKRALELRTEYAGNAGVIRVDANDYVCLNEIASFFPDQRIDNWMRLDQTKQFILAVEKEYIIPQNRGIIAKRGKGGGTWAHPMIAFEFATWLSPEFKLKVYREYAEGRQLKNDWNIKRILAANNYKLMTDAVKDAHDPVKHYHFSNEALMINEIVFGLRAGDVRDTASEEELDRVAELEQHNATMIILEIPFQIRKAKLNEIYRKAHTKQLEAIC